MTRAPALLALAAVAVAGCAVALAGCAARGAPAAGPASPAATSPGPPDTASPAPTAARSAPSRHPRNPGLAALTAAAGAAPQTSASPTAADPLFGRRMQLLWRAVVTGDADLAEPAFFPLAAYRQVKAISDPAADWNSRLYGDFRLDVAAAHRLLGPAAGSARLLQVVVPAAQAAWIVPGGCYNRIGYWHVAGARVVYREGGAVRSFGIASLISWRGEWFVVHFGAVLRSAAVGIVDSPAAGPGVPGPAGGC